MKPVVKDGAEARSTALLALALALLTGCGGGGGGGDSEQATGTTSFRAYAASAGADRATPTALTAAERDEAAQRSREWAVATLVPPGGGFGSSPDNLAGGGAGFELVIPPPPVACSDTDLHPAYLALVNELGGVEMLARFTTLAGVRCI